jgi:UDP-N-acetylglucosamine 2-epimerase (non-hydrolysing)
MALKVMTVVGTRPELIKLSRVIHELDRHTRHVLVHTGQNYDYELNEIFFNQLDIRKPDHFLDVASDRVARAIGNVIDRTDEVLEEEKPDAFLILGDTNSCLSAIAAKRRKIPVFHMEAGNRCFDDRVPEEINRRIIDHISDINLAYTEHARRYLLAEGIRPETVIKTGSPMKEVLTFYRAGIDASDALKRLKLKEQDYFIVSAHREENIDSEVNFTDLLRSLNRIARHFRKKIIVSTHPRTRKKLQGSRRIKCESSILNFPAVTIRQAHERPEGMDEGTLIMSGLAAERVIEAVETVTTQFHRDVHRTRVVPDYDVDDVSKKVVRIILSYTDYVNRRVWYK